MPIDLQDTTRLFECLTCGQTAVHDTADGPLICSDCGPNDQNWVWFVEDNIDDLGELLPIIVIIPEGRFDCLVDDLPAGTETMQFLDHKTGTSGVYEAIAHGGDQVIEITFERIGVLDYEKPIYEIKAA